MQSVLPRMALALVFCLCACSRNYRQKDLRLVTNGISESVHGAVVSSGFFSNAGARPYLGRFFPAAKSQRTSATEVVVSSGIWDRVFHRRPEIIGSTVQLDNSPAIVVGVADPDFVVPDAGEVWILREEGF